MENKGRVVYNYLKYRNHKKFKSKEALRRYQDKGIKTLLKHLEVHSNYYRAYVKNAHGKLSALPIMDKVTMMANFDDLVCVDISKEEAFEMAIDSEKSRDFTSKHNDITVGLSSGTSDHRGLFLASQKEADIWTGSILGRLLPHMSGHQEIAFFLRANSSLYENVKTKKIGFNYFDIYKPMAENIKALESLQANILIAPPSVLILLADAVEEGLLNLKLKKVISVAEVLEDRDRLRFAKVFGQKIIHQVYQCTEGFLGCTCEYGTLHINEDIVLIEEEPIDEQRFIPIITDFTRRSQPIVRYRLNDVLVKKLEPCPCGSHFMALEKIEGREDDVFEFASAPLDGKGSIDVGYDLVKVFPDLVRRCILYVDGIKHYQVIQKDIGRVRVLLEYDQCEIEVASNEAKDIRDEAKDIREGIVAGFERLSKQLRFIMPEIEFGTYEHVTDKKLKRVKRL